MIYPQDFPSNKISNHFTISTSNNDFNTKGLGKTLTSGKIQTIQIRSVWTRYCLNSSVHGLRYLVEPTFKANERYTFLLRYSMVNLYLILFSGLFGSFLSLWPFLEPCTFRYYFKYDILQISWRR